MMINLTKLILIGYTQRYYNLCITGTWGYMIPYLGVLPVHFRMFGSIPDVMDYMFVSHHPNNSHGESYCPPHCGDGVRR